MKRINLLPKPKRQEIMYERLFHSISVAVVLATCVLLLGIVVQLFVWAYLQKTEQILINNIESLKRATSKTENTEVKQRIRIVNNEMKDFEQLSALQPQWSKVLDSFSSLVPNGVKITNFVADNTKLKVEISGYSPTRDQVIELYNNINADKTNFKDIDYPLENVSQPTNIQFHFTFTIQEGILSPKK